MTQNELVGRVLARSEIRQLMLPPESGGLGRVLTDIKKEAADLIPSAVREVATAYPWDFAIKETTIDSVKDQSDYTLRGSDSGDCLDIYNIRYEGSSKPLEFKTPAAMDDILGRRTISTISYWVPSGRSSKFPVVKIVATPSTSGETITYRYYRNNVTLSEIPGVCDYLLEVAVAKRFVSSLEVLYDKVLVKAIGAYDRSGGETDVAVQDSEVVRANNARFKLNGWSQ